MDGGSGPCLTVPFLRELLRNLNSFRALYENEGVDTISGPDGSEMSLWDIEYLREQCSPPNVSVRQADVIELCIVQGYREREVARILGVGSNTPVAIYATKGLTRIIKLIDDGELPRYRNLSIGGS